MITAETPLRTARDAAEERFTPQQQPAATAVAPIEEVEIQPSLAEIAIRASVNGGDDVKARHEVIAANRRDANRLSAISLHYAVRLEQCRHAIFEATAAFKATLKAGKDTSNAIVDGLMRRADLLQRIERDRASLAYAQQALASPQSVSLPGDEVSRLGHISKVMPGVIERLEAELSPMLGNIRALATAGGFELGPIVQQLSQECRDASGRVTDQGLASHLSTGRIPSQ